MMRRGWHYLLLGLACWLLFMLCRFPAAVGYELIEESLGSELRLAGVSGTVWHGEAAQLQYRGRAVARVEWQLSVWPMLLGRVAGELRLIQDNAYLQTELSLPFSAAGVEMTGVEGRLPLVLLQPYLRQLPLPLSGVFSLKLEALSLAQGGRLQRALGRVVWHQAGVSAPQPLSFGDLQMTLAEGEAGAIEGVIRDSGGPVQLQAKLLLAEDGGYTLRGRARAAESAPAQLRQSLGLLGKADAEGFYPLNFSGVL